MFYPIVRMKLYAQVPKVEKTMVEAVFLLPNEYLSIPAPQFSNIIFGGEVAQFCPILGSIPKCLALDFKSTVFVSIKSSCLMD